MGNSLEKADEFLRVSSQFRLGNLPTEIPHPLTARLSELALSDLPAALRTLRDVDLHMLQVLRSHADDVQALSAAMRETLASGGRIFFCGCGATGRLSLSIEVLWREAYPDSESVFSFMAGGDVALIRSIEDFEDHPEFGERQLEEAGFRDGDLLVASTEGGETPWVIGATLHATRLSSRKPFFLYCNPDEVLVERLERCRAVLTHPGVRRICLFVGSMAVSGSTRMQASTILMLCGGLALFGTQECLDAPRFVDDLEKTLRTTDIGFLAPFIEREASTYQSGNHVTYATNAYGITLLTDTTERAPTFSLAPFENQNDPAAMPSLCYLCMPEATTPSEGWRSLLKRAPRPLDWEPYLSRAGERTLLGFDFSGALVQHRRRRVPTVQHLDFSVHREGSEMVFRFDGLEGRIPVGGLHLLQEHLLLKMLMNMHSTLIMGRLGRYHGNIMTWVRPSNLKLIDRSARYVQMLLEREGIAAFSYEDIVRQCFAEMETLAVNEPVVLKTFDALRRKATAAASPGLPVQASRQCADFPG